MFLLLLFLHTALHIVKSSAVKEEEEEEVWCEAGAEYQREECCTGE